MAFLFHPYVLLGIIGALALIGLSLLAWALRIHLRKRPEACCPQCEYDLQHLKKASGWVMPIECVECGFKVTEEKLLYRRRLPWKRMVLGVFLLCPLIAPAWLYVGYLHDQSFVAWSKAAGKNQVDKVIVSECALDGVLSALPKAWTEKLRQSRWCRRVMRMECRPNFNEMERLSGLTNLMSLYAADTQLSDLSPLSGLTRLEYLNMKLNTQVSDLTALSGLKNLKYLYVSSDSNNQVSDLSSLSGLIYLKELKVSDTQVSDLTALSGLTNLKYLFIFNNQVSNLSPLSGLTNLSGLNVSDTHVSDLSALSGMTNLKFLVVSNTQVTDLSSLSCLTSLEELYISNTSVSDADVEKLRKALPNCKINK